MLLRVLNLNLWRSAKAALGKVDPNDALVYEYCDYLETSIVALLAFSPVPYLDMQSARRYYIGT
jgi:hypothetical protein